MLLAARRTLARVGLLPARLRTSTIVQATVMPYQWYTSVGFAEGANRFRIERYSATAGSLAHTGSFGFLTKAIARAPRVRSGAFARAIAMIDGSIDTDAR